MTVSLADIPLPALKETPALDLGLGKARAESRIVVAMSGGVDSSATAALLSRAGYDVVGVTLQLYDHGVAIERKGACCAGQDIYDARMVADSVGFPHYVLDFESKFQENVIEDFADSYLRGETPIPCVRCNQTVKFRDLLDVAQDLGAEALVTGHYAQRVKGAQGYELHRGMDPEKDQSYFLFATTQEQLNFLRFPLGGQDKDQTRRLAEQLGLAVADKPDSQDICFVPDGNYSRVVQKMRPDGNRAGEICHLDGRVLGQHDGVIHYTIGQRKGLGIGGRMSADGQDTEPLYVVRLDPQTRRVIVGPRAALARRWVLIDAVNWLGDQKDLEAFPSRGLPVTVKLRSAQAPASAHLFPQGWSVVAQAYQGQDDLQTWLTADAAEAWPMALKTAESPQGPLCFPQGRAAIRLDTPLYGLAPGQACVFYDQDRVLGGGWIKGSLPDL